MELRAEFFHSVHTALASIPSTPLSFLSYFKIKSMLTLSHFSPSLPPSHGAWNGVKALVCTC